ncbi:MAG: hypothetical protein L3K09_07185 [Thermoplasmata archaeon]|nr:hypothetical protein [Thermoplasmata archaeon]
MSGAAHPRSSVHARAHPASEEAPAEVQHLPPHWQPAQVRPSLPVGVGLLSVGIALIGLFVLLSGALYLLNVYAGTVVPSQLLVIQDVSPVGAAILVVLGAAFLSLASALWDREAWALYTTVAVLFLALAYLFFTASITVLFLVVLVLFVYLLTVRHHFV